jgi:hypothetical protein
MPCCTVQTAAGAAAADPHSAGRIERRPRRPSTAAAAVAPLPSQTGGESTSPHPDQHDRLCRAAACRVSAPLILEPPVRALRAVRPPAVSGSWSRRAVDGDGTGWHRPLLPSPPLRFASSICFGSLTVRVASDGVASDSTAAPSFSLHRAPIRVSGSVRCSRGASDIGSDRRGGTADRCPLSGGQ